MSWSARDYQAFENERTRPVHDLLNAIPKTAVRHAIDLGCGPGNSTEVISQRFPTAKIFGLDSSTDMIEAARLRLPGHRFEIGTLDDWTSDEAYDLMLANASLHWVPDHRKLLPSLVRRLAPSGSLAVQMPDNLEEPAHRIMREVARSGPWAGRLADAAAQRAVIETPTWYYELLQPLCRRVDVWRTVYHHPLGGGAEAIVSWFQGSGLRPFLAALDDGDRGSFLDRYCSAIAPLYPELADGVVLLPFPRLFIVATR